MTLFFEDFAVGDLRNYGRQTVSAEDIIAFASVFDAQDFHLDAEAAKSTFVGGLIGSGWHTSAMMMRMMAEAFLLDSAGLGAPGIDELKWIRPVRPGDTLSVRHTVLEVKESRSKPEIGLVRFRFEVMDQNAAPVQEVTNWIIFGRRGQVPAPTFRAPPAPWRYAPPTAIGALSPAPGETRPVPLFDQLEIGERTELGSFTFAADDIVAFAQAFDPQRFHLDEAAAKASLFGGLCASGWHTGAVWMRLMVANRRRVQHLMGDAMPRLGSSPGLRNLKWLKPVFAGDTISYASTMIEKRASVSRPGWGLVFHHNTATNQRGETVFMFDGCVFWQR
ncbi:MAG: MaoC family dehydratase [Hyphomicrobiales bacterium]|jgi:acyl dehydratase|nr:MaoC family dehydratase [Hyphomicrobiales bacterium]